MSQEVAASPASTLHPIATMASASFIQGNRSFTPAALAELNETLEAISGTQELGPAIASLIQVAQYLEYGEKAKAASVALLRVAMSQTAALELLNDQAKKSVEDQARAKRKAFSKFTGR
jgi:hypothetical protein